MHDSKLRVFLGVYAVIMLLYIIFGSTWNNKEQFAAMPDDGSDPNADALASLAVQNNAPMDPIVINPAEIKYPTSSRYFIGTSKAVSEYDRQRDCSIYYTRQRETCDAYEKLYNLPIDALASKLTDPNLPSETKSAIQIIIKDLQEDSICKRFESNKSKTPQELQSILANGSADEKKAAQLFIDGRCSVLMPNRNVCKINLSRQGWVEPKVTPDGQNAIPYKNLTDTEVMNKYGDPLNWGYCYKDTGAGSVATAVANVADGKGFINNPNKATPFFGDTREYAELKFSTLAFDDYENMRSISNDTYASHLGISYCKMAKAPPQDLPNVCFKCIISDAKEKGKYVLQEMQLVKLNTTTLQFEEVSAYINMLQVFYQKVWSVSNRSLMLIPRPLSGSVLVVYYDACGRVDSYDAIPVTFSLTDIADIESSVLATSASQLTDGEYDDVAATIVSLNQEISKQQAEIDKYNSVTIAPSYRQGLIMDEYSSSSPSSIPTVNSEASMSAAKNSMIKTTRSLPKIVGNTGFDASTAAMVHTGTTMGYKLYEWTGYIKTPIESTATYYFMMIINDVTTIDVKLNNQVIMSRYSGPGTTITSRGIPISGNTYVPFSVRVLTNSPSGGSFSLFWNDAGRSSTFQYINSNVYFYNYNRILLDTAIYKRQQAINNRDIVVAYIDNVDKVAYQLAIDTFNKARKNKNLQDSGKSATNFLGEKWNPKYMSGINARALEERNVFINFTAHTGLYYDAGMTSSEPLVDVIGNNGTVTCARYCNGRWGKEQLEPLYGSFTGAFSAQGGSDVPDGGNGHCKCKMSNRVTWNQSTDPNLKNSDLGIIS
jgi:hypothetical protein